MCTQKRDGEHTLALPLIRSRWLLWQSKNEGKNLQFEIYWPSIFKDTFNFVNSFCQCQ